MVGLWNTREDKWRFKLACRKFVFDLFYKNVIQNEHKMNTKNEQLYIFMYEEAKRVVNKNQKKLEAILESKRTNQNEEIIYNKNALFLLNEMRLSNHTL